MVSPLVFHFHNPLFQDVPTHILVGHGHEGSAAKNKVSLVIAIEISHNHSSPFSTAYSCVFASYLRVITIT